MGTLGRVGPSSVETDVELENGRRLRGLIASALSQELSPSALVCGFGDEAVASFLFEIGQRAKLLGRDLVEVDAVGLEGFELVLGNR